MPIIRPTLLRRRVTNRQEMIGGETGYPDAANDFAAQSFVVLTSNALVAVASAGVVACGFVQDAAKSSSAINPPDAPFGDRHYPMSLVGQIFAISVVDATGNVGEANGAPQLSEVSLGTSYGILRPTSGDYSGYQFLNVDNTTNLFFQVVEKPTSWNGIAQDANTYNPIVFAQVIQTIIQQIGG